MAVRRLFTTTLVIDSYSDDAISPGRLFDGRSTKVIKVTLTNTPVPSDTLAAVDADYLLFITGRIAAKRQTVGIKFTQRPKISRGDSLHRFTRHLSRPRDTWVRLATRNFTPTGSRGVNEAPKYQNFHFLPTRHFSTMNISEMTRDTAIVTIERQ